MKECLNELCGIDENSFAYLEGIAPASVALKLEGGNPAGSIKLKTALGLLEAAEKDGLIHEDSILIESSSGSLGVALAMLCAQRRYRFCCVVDPNASPASVRIMKTAGAEVICVDQRDRNSGYLGTRIKLIEERLRSDPRYIWLNQYKNAAGPDIHRRTTAPAILRALPGIEYLFIGAGTTGTLMGCAAHFKEFRPQTRIIAVDTCGSVTFGGLPGPRHIPGIGTSRVPEICRPELVDEIVHVPEGDAIRMCRYAARRHGLLLGGSTGSVLAAIGMTAHLFPPTAVIGAISPDFGERYLDTVYNDDWVLARFGHETLKEFPEYSRPQALQTEARAG